MCLQQALACGRLRELTLKETVTRTPNAGIGALPWYRQYLLELWPCPTRPDFGNPPKLGWPLCPSDPNVCLLSQPGPPAPPSSLQAGLLHIGHGTATQKGSPLSPPPPTRAAPPLAKLWLEGLTGTPFPLTPPPPPVFQWPPCVIVGDSTLDVLSTMTTCFV